MARKLAAEFLGTAVLVFIGVGAATLVFGFHEFGFRSAGSVAAGVLSVGMAFGLTLLALVFVLGPISACHVNPAVTLGAVLTRRIGIAEAAGYWAAQFAGGIVGALVLYWLLTFPAFRATGGARARSCTSPRAARSWPRSCWPGSSSSSC